MERPETIVLVSVDDLRYDSIGSTDSDAWLEKYGAAEYVDTPTMDTLVDEGISFERATSTSSYTPPSHASLFTGCYPSEHGVKTFFNRLQEQQTLAESLSEAGYETVAWIENMALRMLDVTSGFDEVVCPFEDPDLNLFDFVDRQMSDGPVFLFIHLFDVHKPYGYTTGGTERTAYNEDYPVCLDPMMPDGLQPSEWVDDAKEEARSDVPNYDNLTTSLKEFADFRSLDYLVRERLKEAVGDDRFEYLVRHYVEGVNRFDQNRLTDLLDVVNERRGESSMLLFTSDHGETRCQWGDRDDFWNTFNVSEGAVRIPLVLDIPADYRSALASADIPVSHVDVYPTITDVIDMENPTTSGESLFSSLSPDRVLFNEAWYYSGGADFFGNLKETGEGGLSEIAVRIGDCKIIRRFAETSGPREQIVDLSAPIPEETENPADCLPASALEKELDGVLERISLDCSPDVGGDQEDIEDRLKALGYLE